MDYSKEGLLNKVRSMVSALYGVVSCPLWVTRLSSPVKSHQYPQPGLTALLFSTSQNSIVIHSYMTSTFSSSSLSSMVLEELNHSSSSSWSHTMGDLLGTESGVCMKSNPDMLREEKTKPYTSKRSHPNQRLKMKKEYPPPIPLLARTGNLPGRMPWILAKEYVDGRLVLSEAKLNRYEYFEAIRENGRLILNLIPLDHTIEEENENAESCAEVDEKVQKELLCVENGNGYLDKCRTIACSSPKQHYVR